MGSGPGARRLRPCVDDPAAGTISLLRASLLGSTAEDTRSAHPRLAVPTPTAVTPAVILTSRPGDALNALLRGPGQIVATGPSAVTDPRGGPGAAVDGDPRTVWTAPKPAREESDDPERSEKPEHPERPRALRRRCRDEDSAEPKNPTLEPGCPPGNAGTTAHRRTSRLSGRTDAGVSRPDRAADPGRRRRRAGAPRSRRHRPHLTDHPWTARPHRREQFPASPPPGAPPGIAEIEITPAPTTPRMTTALSTAGCADGLA